MSTHLFENFVKSMATLPDAAVMKALDFQYKLLQDEIRHTSDVHRDAHSVFCFILYVRAAKEGKALGVTVPLPEDQIGFYKETIVRLVRARELPPGAIDYFSKAFVGR